MVSGEQLRFERLSKDFSGRTAVSDLSFAVEPGIVTGFLGPNGAGKTTTLRILLGLVAATAGTATIGGTRYADLDNPQTRVGAALDATSFHPGRTGRNHLHILALAGAIDSSRVDAVLTTVGLAEAGNLKVGAYSMGMRQRLSLAAALLGDPGVLVLDEPINGLDPEGIHWIRGFLRHLAAEGRTVLISSHLLSEVEQSVDQLVIISRGSLVYEGSVGDLSRRQAGSVLVDSPERERLAQLLRQSGLEVIAGDSGLTVVGADAVGIGSLAHYGGVALSHLSVQSAGLERVFLDLIQESDEGTVSA